MTDFTTGVTADSGQTPMPEGHGVALEPNDPRMGVRTHAEAAAGIAAARASQERPMRAFAGVQTQTLDAPNPDAPVYKDPMQWWYDLGDKGQQEYTEKKLKIVREIMAVVGVSSMPSHETPTPTNPYGINAAILARYNEIIADKGYTAKPVEVLKEELAMHSSEIEKIEQALSTFAGVQG